MLDVSDMKVVVDGGNTFDMGDNEGVVLSEKMNDSEFLAELVERMPWLWLILRIYFYLIRGGWATQWKSSQDMSRSSETILLRNLGSKRAEHQCK